MFNMSEFQRAKYQPRTAKVQAREIGEFFRDEDGAELPEYQQVIEVRGLTAAEMAGMPSRSQQIGQIRDALVGVLAGMEGGGPEKAVDALKEAIGVGDGNIPHDVIYRAELIVKGAINPKFNVQQAMHLANNFPKIFGELSNKILLLTNEGAEASDR